MYINLNNLNRNDDPRLGCITHPLPGHSTSQISIATPVQCELAVLLSIPKLWESSTTDKALAFFNCPFPKKLTASTKMLTIPKLLLSLLQTYEIPLRKNRYTTGSCYFSCLEEKTEPEGKGK